MPFNDRGRQKRTRGRYMRSSMKPNYLSWTQGRYKLDQLADPLTGVPDYHFDDPRPISFGRAVTHGSALPNWRGIIQAGGNATTSFEAWTRDVDFDALIYQMKGTSYMGGQWQEDCINSSPTGARDPLTSFDPSVIDRVVQAALQAALNRMKPQFQAYTFLGELRETLHMIRKPAMALRNAINTFANHSRRLRSKARNLRTYRRAVADSWLESSFGWQPLISDIRSGAEAFAQLSERPRYSTFSGSSTEKLDVPESLVTSYGTGVAIHVFEKSTQTISARYFGKIRLHAGSSNLYRGFGLEWQEFIPAGWELIPGSFLVDYFSNVGDLVDASVRISTTDFQFVVGQLHCTGVFTQSHRLGSAPSYDSLSFKPGTFIQALKHYKRDSLDSLPLPHLRVGFEGMSFKRSLNLSALAVLAADRRR